MPLRRGVARGRDRGLACAKWSDLVYGRDGQGKGEIPNEAS